jgi:predicted Zn-dependent protease with MMP-like domain
MSGPAKPSARTGRREPDRWTGTRAPSLDDLEQLARAAFAALPEHFLKRVGEIRIAVADFPDNDVLADLGAESEFEILGLFHGVGLAHSAATPETGRLPNMIWLYRRPILDYWADNDDALGGIVTHVLVHEIGHHFGLSDEDMEAIEAAAS